MEKDGDRKGRVYLVVDGALNVIKGGVIIGTVEAGQFVEEVSTGHTSSRTTRTYPQHRH